MKNIIIPTLCAICALPVFTEPAQAAVVRPVVTQETDIKLPEIWQNIPMQERLQYIRAAEMDATRALAEHIMGATVEGDTTVRDLTAADDQVTGYIVAFLKGVRNTEQPTYFEDGRIEIVRAVNISKLIEQLRTKTNVSGKKLSVSTTTRKETETVEALGNAAIPGTLGHKRVLSKRAAEMDVYRLLAERVAGLEISGKTTVRDFAVDSDVIKASMIHTIKGADFTNISYGSDGITRVTAKLKVAPLVRVIVRERESNGKTLNVQETVKEMVLEETGQGTIAESDKNEPTSAETTVEVIVTSVLR